MSDNTGESILDRLRGTGVGTEDPNIVGDVGPTEVLRHLVEHALAELLSNPRLEAALAERLK